MDFLENWGLGIEDWGLDCGFISDCGSFSVANEVSDGIETRGKNSRVTALFVRGTEVAALKLALEGIFIHFVAG